MRVLALDVGGTAIKAAVVGHDGKVSDPRFFPSRPAPADVLAELAVAAANVYDDYDVLAVSLTGQIDHKTQTVLAKTNGKEMVRAQFPVGQILRQGVEKPVFVINDANAATLAEACFGAGRGHANFLCLTYGTGVGGGIIQDGELLTGQHGIAGEVGHMILHSGGRICRCGRRGCYQEYASATALLRMAREIAPELQNVRELFDKIPQLPALQRVVKKWAGQVAQGLCTLAYIFDPDCFVLGGGVMERADVLELVRQQFQKQVIPSFSDIELKAAELGNQAGMFGAAEFARRMLSGGEETHMTLDIK